jgi:replicative DNA helicase
VTGIVRRAGDVIRATNGWEHVEDVDLTDEEREALARVLVTFPSTTIEPLDPVKEEPPSVLALADADERPDAVLPELEPIPLPPQMVDGLVFALDASGEEVAIWGREDDIAHASGEATLIIGPDGVGKTTLVQRYMLARSGIGSKLLGMYVEPAERRILYVSADRPKQAARSLLRMVAELDPHDAGKLKEAVLVWRGPLPFDLVREPAMLTEWARGFDVDEVVLDSLGFVVRKLADDETGSAIAQAFSTAAAEGLDIVALGHPRKPPSEGGTKPTTIHDVYGSRWLTAACGSILSLWGMPGDPVVELRQLKSPRGDVGPFPVEIDHERGTVERIAGTDILASLRGASAGLTVKEAARLFEGGSERARAEKARRKLEQLVGRDLAYKREGSSVTDPTRYFATPPKSLGEGP